jgi:hypothetical protein
MYMIFWVLWRLIRRASKFSLPRISDLKNEGDIFLRNVGLSPNYTELEARRPYST